MSFLHSEFFIWLLPPTFALFYFWLTQKPLQHRWLSETVVEKLRAPETTMGLKARNVLFFIAAILLIGAMAQPVILNSTPIKGEKLHILLVVDRGEGDAEKSRSLALSTLYTLVGEEIELAAFDYRLYRISPRSDDIMILRELIRHLSVSSKPSNLAVIDKPLRQSSADMIVIVTSKTVENREYFAVASATDVAKVHQRLLVLREKAVLQEHIPLFFYPLGMAMVLILIALSSMSKRRSVSVATVMFILGTLPHKSEAGFFDFQLLREAKGAYERGEYEKSERLYSRYQLEHDSPQVRYNRANALYMGGHFERSRYWYERVYTSDPFLSERVRHNLEQSKIQIKKREAKKKHQESNAPKESSAAHDTPLPPLSKRAVPATPLFEW